MRTDGIISPGGVGFDINCGVRLLRTDLDSKSVQPLINTLIDALFEAIPSGLGATGRLKASDQQLTEAFISGSKWAVEQGYGVEADVTHCEENGHMPGADPAQVSAKARKRGRPQLGTLGSGNHFLEIQRVEEIFDEEKAKQFGLFKGQITIMIHCGSRGAGHQICTDHLEVLNQAVKKYNIEIPDKQLACAPLGSPEAERYFGGMVCAANYAWANRHIIAHWTREVFERYFPEASLDLVYDVAHNVAKIEEHDVDGKRMRLYVHRKGATRAFGPSRIEVPATYRSVGQPVLIPGSMGTASYVLCGNDNALNVSFRLRLPRRGPGHEPKPGHQIVHRQRREGCLESAGNRGQGHIACHAGRRGSPGLQALRRCGGCGAQPQNRHQSRQACAHRSIQRMNLRVVLVEPLYEGNVGSVARAMKNFGFHDLVMVNPCKIEDYGSAMASHARDVLQMSKSFSSLPEALEGANLVVGTTGKRLETEQHHLRLHLRVPCFTPVGAGSEAEWKRGDCSAAAGPGGLRPEQ